MRESLRASEIAPLVRAAVVAQGNVRQLDDMAQRWLANHCTWQRAGYAELQRDSLNQLETDSGDAVLVQVLKRLGGSSALRQERLDLLDWLCQPGAGRRTLAGFLFAKRSQLVVVGREAGRIAAGEGVVPDDGIMVWDRRFVIHAPAGSRILPVACVPGYARNRELPAFVQNSLPAIVLPDGKVVVPYFQQSTLAKAELIRF